MIHESESLNNSNIGDEVFAKGVHWPCGNYHKMPEKSWESGKKTFLKLYIPPKSLRLKDLSNL